MSKVKHAIAVVKEKLGNADKHNLGYQRFSIAEMEAIWGVLAKTDAAEGKLPACKAVKEIWKDRAWTAEEKLADVQQKLDALAAENAALNEVISAVRGVADNSEGIAGWHLNGDVAGWDEILPEIDDIETPATDAYLNTISAEGVIMFASKQLAAAGDLESTITLERLMLDAEEFAGQLRAGKDGE